MIRGEEMYSNLVASIMLCSHNKIDLRVSDAGDATICPFVSFEVFGHSETLSTPILAYDWEGEVIDELVVRVHRSPG